MNHLIRYEPLVGRLDGLFDDFFRSRSAWDGSAHNDPTPIRFDVRETPEAYVVAAELPGVAKDNIHVEIEGNEVTISAELQRASEPKDGEKWLRIERRYGKSARRFALPQEVDESRSAAKFADGVLELTLPKKAQVTGRKLQVQ